MYYVLTLAIIQATDSSEADPPPQPRRAGHDTAPSKPFRISNCTLSMELVQLGLDM